MSKAAFRIWVLVIAFGISSPYLDASTKGKGLEVKTIAIPGSLIKFEVVRLPESATAKKKLWIAKTETTWEAFDIFAFRLDLTQEEQAKGVDAQSRPSRPYGAPDRGFGHNGYPAIGMTFLSAQSYCDWLSKKTGLKFRLPTESEWESAASSGGTQKFQPLEDYAWFFENAKFKTHPVGKKKPNDWGIHDMLGNVCEWTVTDGGTGAVRGGSFLEKKESLSVMTRGLQVKGWNMTDPQNPKSKWWLSDAPFVGFRVVLEED
jgi:formylglycine-generating enzyme required for sulfatase activity